MSEKYLEDYVKMKVLREIAEEDPNGIINALLKSLDKAYIKNFQKLKPPKKKSAFITKF